MKVERRSLVALGAAAGLAGIAGTAVAQAQNADATYRAELAPLNSRVTGSDAAGEAVLTISGDQLTIHIEVTGVPPGIAHLQHFHGFPDADQASRCPTLEDDANGDGVIDIVETEPAAGTTMVPFHSDPVNMAVVDATYPVADADGAYTYDVTVSLSALEDAFEAQFPGQHLDLDRRVIFVHTVPDSTELAATVASLGDIPAQVTLPIACGALERVAD